MFGQGYPTVQQGKLLHFSKVALKIPELIYSQPCGHEVGLLEHMLNQIGRQYDITYMLTRISYAV